MPHSFGKTVGGTGSFPFFSAELAWLGDMRVNPISGSHTTGDVLTLFVNYVKQWTKLQSGVVYFVSWHFTQWLSAAKEVPPTRWQDAQAVSFASAARCWALP